MRNVVIRQDQFQGCTATSSPFELNQGKEVTVAGPVPGTIYQAIKAGKTSATATVYYLTENGSPVTLQNHLYSPLVSDKMTYLLWKKMTKDSMIIGIGIVAIGSLLLILNHLLFNSQLVIVALGHDLFI